MEHGRISHFLPAKFGKLGDKERLAKQARALAEALRVASFLHVSNGT